jgi:hypothetical protein
MLANFVSKSIYYFEIYSDENLEIDVRMKGPYGEAGATYGAVMKMLHSLKRRNHRIVIDNYFCFIPLFQNLIQK